MVVSCAVGLTVAVTEQGQLFTWGSSIMKIHAGMPMESDIETIGSTKNTNANEK